MSTVLFIGSNLMSPVPRFRIFAGGDSLSGFYYLFDDGLSPIHIYSGNKIDITSVEEPSLGVDDLLSYSVFSPYELYLFFDFFPLEKTSIGLVWNSLPITLIM